ncbi:hypothetical protein niasHT_032672 [Heterodera trifolii]|uniref:Glutamyl-tRNA(Gln) amidotransferase subunit A, mitochondrial n=1 Tax=Heterodera trifolii TaxID=157864 RepID=A0ABD2IXD7_9BILA
MHRVKHSVGCARRFRHLNFLISETFGLAEAQWETALKKHQRPFIMTIKDNYAVKGVRMTCASKMLSDYVPPYTATCVQRLLDNGGCMVGKTNMDEFAMGSSGCTGYFGPVRHAMYASTSTAGDDFRIAGGSSSGCAVAVGSGVADISLGSDTGGSVRFPASFSGVYGFKPSYGRLSRHGLVPLNNSLDTPSIFTHSAEQCRTFFDILKGHDPLDATSVPDDLVAAKADKSFDPSAPNKLTVGVPEFHVPNLLSADAQRAWDAAIALFERAGARVRKVSMPHWPLAIRVYAILTDRDVASNMARYDGIRFGHNNAADLDLSFAEQIAASRTETLGQNVKRRIFAGNYFGLHENYDQFVGQAMRVRRLIQRDFQHVFATQCDVLLTPSTRRSAPLLSELVGRPRVEFRMDDFFLVPANIAGVPAISVPFAHCAQGHPLGVQLVGPYLADEFLLDIAKLLVPLPNPAVADGESQAKNNDDDDDR